MIESDRDIEEALRSVGHETPPVAIDEAIRAAARREVGAGPRRMRATRWWFPLAAAAAVAIIAFGVVQLTPQERIAPSVATDMPNVPRDAKQEAASAIAPAPPAAAPVEQRADSAMLNVPAAAPARTAQQMAPPPPAHAPLQPTAQPTQKLSAARDALDATAPGAQNAARERDSPASLPPAPAVARSEPFPAAPAAGGAPIASTYASAERKDAVTPAPVLNSAAPSDAVIVTGETGRAARPAALGKVAAADAARANDALRPADEWIATIRKLKSEGRTEEAAKELAAFRAAYKERADALLPADLKPAKP